MPAAATPQHQNQLHRLVSSLVICSAFAVNIFCYALWAVIDLAASISQLMQQLHAQLSTADSRHSLVEGQICCGRDERMPGIKQSRLRRPHLYSHGILGLCGDARDVQHALYNIRLLLPPTNHDEHSCYAPHLQQLQSLTGCSLVCLSYMRQGQDCPRQVAGVPHIKIKLSIQGTDATMTRIKTGPRQVDNGHNHNEA